MYQTAGLLHSISHYSSSFPSSPYSLQTQFSVSLKPPQVLQLPFSLYVQPPKLSRKHLTHICSQNNTTLPSGSSSGNDDDAIYKKNTNSRWSLTGMTALVTGGTRGIGHAIVTELVEFGARVHTCSRNDGELNKRLEDWRDKGFEITGSVCHVSVHEDREKLMETVSSLFDGKLNILINNVGTNIRKPTVDFSPEEFSHLMKTNLESVFHLCQLGHPLLKASGVGSIVFTSSVSGFVSLKSMSVHGATKGAINQLTRFLACEWAADKIRSNAVAPWYIKTSMVEQVNLFLLYRISISTLAGTIVDLNNYCLFKRYLYPLLLPYC